MGEPERITMSRDVGVSSRQQAAERFPGFQVLDVQTQEMIRVQLPLQLEQQCVCLAV